ncbi:DoxX family protein [Candidatus Palauibacter sp.]|uniref:DoxX family protein n=1 Tax=Candidatus Palauibacter sp. TaxID=3101350 RepID=UPI003B5A1565
MTPRRSPPEPPLEAGASGEPETGALTPRAWAAFVSRTILGLIFFMAGFWKVFELGPLQHARGMFVESYADTLLPDWSLWATGVAVPFVELVAGALMLAGWQRRIAALALGSVLILVTFGHLLAEPLYAFDAHVIPRALLLVLVLILFEDDRLSLDDWLARRIVPR